LTLLNIYNNCKHDNTLELLTEYHRNNLKELLGNTEMQYKHHLIWVGDFNHHHPYWDSPDNNSLFTQDTLERAELLIQTVAEVGLDLAFPTGIPTHKHNMTKQWSRLDQVFATEHTLKAITQCKALPMEQGLNTDHFQVISNFNLDIELTPKKVLSNFRDIDWEEFHEALEKKIRTWGVPNFIKSQEILDRKCERLMHALQETIAETVPKVVLGPQAKWWWTKELGTLRQEMLKSQ
jgi:hypothetical protein